MYLQTVYTFLVTFCFCYFFVSRCLILVEHGNIDAASRLDVIMGNVKCPKKRCVVRVCYERSVLYINALCVRTSTA